MFVLHAKYQHDVERNSDGIEIGYTKFVPGMGFKRFTKWIYAEPLGGWNDLKFTPSDNVDVVDFLLTMVNVRDSLPTQREIARLCNQRWLYRVKVGYYQPYIKLLNALKILDPTFEPPLINLRCSWQREMLHDMCTIWTDRVVSTCMNSTRIFNYINALKNV